VLRENLQVTNAYAMPGPDHGSRVRHYSFYDQYFPRFCDLIPLQSLNVRDPETAVPQSPAIGVICNEKHPLILPGFEIYTSHQIPQHLHPVQALPSCSIGKIHALSGLHPEKNSEVTTHYFNTNTFLYQYKSIASFLI
jgi:hypothetical protein